MNASANQGRMLDRAIDILECVESARTAVKPIQIAKATGLHITTTQRIAATLTRRGYLTVTEGGYLLGPAVLAHAHSFLMQDRLTMASNPVLGEMTEATGLTSSVYVRTGHSRILVARIEAPTPLRYQFPVGLRLRLDVGSGKVLLAQMPDEELDAYLADYSDIVRADGTPQTATSLRADIDDIRVTQTYIGQSERHLGMISITAALTTSAGDPVGAVNLVSNDDTIDAEAMASHRRLLLQASRRIGEQL